MQRRISVAVVTLAALALATLETSPRVLVNLNWDNGGYVADLATWRNYLVHPWSAHFAIAPIYAFFANVAQRFHGTVFDGVRLATIAVFTLSSFLLADLLATITDSAVATIGLGCFFATVWVNQFLLLTVEDNLLYVPLLVLMFRVALLHGRSLSTGVMRSRPVRSPGSPSCCRCRRSSTRSPRSGCASSRDRRTRTRTSHASAPSGSRSSVARRRSPASCSGWRSAGQTSARCSRSCSRHRTHPWRCDTHRTGSARSMRSAGPRALSISHSGYWAPPTYGLTRTSLGLLFVVVVALYGTFLGWRAWRTRSVLLGLVALTLVGFTCATPLRVDDGYAYLKRFDFMPACLALSVALLVGKRARMATIVGLVAMALAGVQLTLGLAWAQRHRDGYTALECPPPEVHPATAYYGRDGKSWVAYFRDIREAHPDACAYVFDLDELDEGRWWQEVPGALWSELPDHVVLGLRSRGRQWRYPPRIVDPRRDDDPRWHQPCAYVSCAAQHHFQHP